MTAAGVDRTEGYVLAREVFAADLQSLPAIRDFVVKWAVAVGLDEEKAFRIKLAVTEAASNAMEHPIDKSDLTLWAWNKEDRFTIDVWHPGDFQAKTGQDRGHRGLGLPIMVATADEVSFASLPEGGTRVSVSVFI